MTEQRKHALEDAGIRVDEALERLMGSEALLERLLRTFLKDENMRLLSEAVAAGSQEAAFQAAHTLKGVCGNLSMEPLTSLVSRQVELLRKPEGWSDAAALLPEIEAAYGRVRSAIEDGA